MSTIKSFLAKLAPVSTGIYFVLVGVAGLTGVAIPGILMALLALFVGLCWLCAS